MTCKVANAFKTQGIKKGDRVVLYMPMIPLAVAVMLACTRIGAVHRLVEHDVIKVNDIHSINYFTVS